MRKSRSGKANIYYSAKQKINFENKNENLIFSGDNLEVLRHLQNNYQSRIEYIY